MWITYEGPIARVMGHDKSGQGCLGAEDGAAEIGLWDGFVLDADAEDGVGVRDAEEDYGFRVRGVEGEGEGVECSVVEERWGRQWW